MTDRPPLNVPVEVTTRYATTVEDYPAAWAFVMDRLDQLELVGESPSVTITPQWWYGKGDDGRRVLSVVVEGMVEEARP